MRSNFPLYTAGAVVVGILAVIVYLLMKPSPQEQPAPQPQTEESAQEVAVQPPEEPLTGEIKREDQPPADPEPVPEVSPAASAPVEPIADIVQPPEAIDGSDTIVRKALLELSPTLAQWLVPEEQVRKWVLAVDKLAKGELVKRYRPLEYKMDKFKVKTYGDMSVLDDANYARYQPLIETLTALDPDVLAAYYQAWKPLLEQAYSQQGESGTFEDRLLIAIDKLLAVEPLPEKGLLIRPHVFYVYQDEALEKESDIEKMCWRMGEENTRALQQVAQEFRQKIVAQ